MEHYVVLALYLTVTCSMYGCCRAEYSALDSSGDDFAECATLGSTVDTCHAAVHLPFGRISHNFYVDVDSEPEVFFLRVHAKWRNVPKHALLARKSRSPSSCTWLAVRTMMSREFELITQVMSSMSPQ